MDYKAGSDAEERTARMENLARKVASKAKCKHGMRFEWCGLCQRVETVVDSKFPMEVSDRETKEPIFNADGSRKVAWIPTQVKRVDYMRYR